MSLLPILFSNWWEDLEHPHRLPSQHFGLGITPERLLEPTIPMTAPLLPLLIPGRKSASKNHHAYVRSWDPLQRGGISGTSTVKADKDKFQVMLDVQQFSPDEISVKLVDRFVVVEGKHEEKEDTHGSVSRQFVRKYMIPEQCDVDQVSSKLSSDGVLSICVPRKPKEAAESERVIDIEHTGKPALNESKPEEKKPEEEQQN